MADICPDCGIKNSPSHRQQWLESFLGDTHARMLEPILNMTAQHSSTIRRLFQRLWKIAAHALARVGMVRLVDDQSDHPVIRTQMLAESAQRLGVQIQNIRFLGYPSNLFLARHNEEEIFFEGVPRPLHQSTAVSWMDDKPRVRAHLGNAGLPVPKGGVARTLDEARAVFQLLQKPVIMKPGSNSGARHTTIGITNEEQLSKAFQKASQVSYCVEIQEEIPGFVHRALMVDGKLAAFARREYPNVKGDGVRTIKELHAQENQHPRRNETLYYPLPALDDPEVQQWLAGQQLTPTSIPAEGQMVRLGFKDLRARGGSFHEITPMVHPETRALCERVAAVVNDPLIGIDVILLDATISWKDQPCGIIELNSTPFINIHIDPLYGEPVMVADDIWNMIFPTLKRRD